MRRRTSPIDGRVGVALAIGLALVAGAFLVLPVPVPSSSSATAPSVHAPAPVPIPPIHVRLLARSSADSVDPTGGYSSEPAPMGIGDFGIGADGTPYTYNTTEFLGNFSWTHLSFSGSQGTSFTDQLNVVLQFVQDGVTYAYWIQDVAFMDSADNSLGFENNIWNFTTSASCLDDTGVSGNGTVYPYSGCEGYYAVSPDPSLPGASLTMPNPGDFGLLVRSYLAGGLPAVAFEYWDGVSRNYVTYDNVVFPWASGITADPGFVVDGYTYNPLGLFYDAELTLGGPGGGSATTADPITHTASHLYYWNGHNFEAPPSVWNFGSDTAEAVSDVQSVFGHDAGGIPDTVQLNGTVRDAAPGLAYAADTVGELDVAAPGDGNGTIATPGDSFDFANAAANLTLVPGAYPLWVNATGGPAYLGVCGVTAGTTLRVSTTTGCPPFVSVPAPSVAGADVGQTISFSTTVESSGSGGDTFAWQTSGTGLGCTASMTTSVSCSPTAPGTYTINVTITDSIGRSSTSVNASFTVDPDPAAAKPTATPASGETGGSVEFSESASGGRSPYAYAWTGLPAGCSGTASSTPRCPLTSVGTFSIDVTVTDANHRAATSSTLSFDVAAGPSVTTPATAPSGTIDVDRPVVLTTDASGGSGGYSFVWTGLPAGCASASSAEISCTPNASGNYSITVRVTDANGGAATSAPAPLRVVGGPVLGGVTASPDSVDSGRSIEFSATGVAGGTGEYRFSWSGLPAGCASVNASSVSCATGVAIADATVALIVVDTDGGNASAEAVYHVLPDPSIGSLRSSRPTTDVGGAVDFSAVDVTGGSGGYAYRWTVLPEGCVSGNASSIACLPTAAGSVNLTLVVTDSSGVSATATLSFVVHPALAAGPLSVSPSSVSRGGAVTLSVAVSGGAGGDAFAWSGLPVGCVAANASSIDCTPAEAGAYSVSVTVSDATGANATAGPVSFTVRSPTASFLGLPGDEGYELLAGIGAGAVVAIGLVVWARRRRGTSPPA